MTGESLQALYTLAHTDLAGMLFGNHGRTLRVVVQSNSHAHGVSVLFSNLCGAEPLRIGAASLGHCDEEAHLLPGALLPLTVGGMQEFVLAPGEEVRSDTASILLAPGEHLALNIYYPDATPVTSGNWLGYKSRRSRPGNFSADAQLNGPLLAKRLARTVMVTDMTTPITSVRRITAHTQNPGRVVACFGDSITQQCGWTDPLAKLLYHKYPGEITLVNLGISGNRLLRGAPAGESFGEAGITRFARDVLEVEGLTHAILGLGSNDLGQPGSHGIPEDEIPTLREYADAMENLAGQLRVRGVRVYANTITPRAVDRVFTPDREELRLVFNEWIRTAACFDAVLDFDAMARRDNGLPGMKDHYVLPDGLHPSVYGGLCLAKGIDLSLFAGGEADG